jgi:SAM-dependent methyltransferase
MTFAPPVDALNQGHATLWGNLGDWSEASEYVEAAAALARRLGEAAGLGAGQHVVDLGPGGGDQLRMWVEAFGVERVTAVELDPDLAGRGAERVRSWGLDPRVRLVVGEATTASWTDPPVDRALALDSAYFFASREAFLRRCASALRQEGVLAVTDLLQGEGAPARLARAVAPLFGVPGDGILTEAQYRALLMEHGFHDIAVHDCTDQVLGGFSRWIRRGGHLRGPAPALATRLGLSITGRVAGILARPGGLRYVVVTGRRGEG